MNYSPVSGWMLDYFYKFATGTFKSGMNSEQVSGVFNNLMASPVEMIIWLAIIALYSDFLYAVEDFKKALKRSARL